MTPNFDDSKWPRAFEYLDQEVGLRPALGADLPMCICQARSVGRDHPMIFFAVFFTSSSIGRTRPVSVVVRSARARALAQMAHEPKNKNLVRH
jgi:hypothetical protein